MRIWNYEETDLSLLLMRTMEDNQLGPVVAEIIAKVAKEGDQALKDFAARFDHAELTDLEVSREEIQKAREAVGPDLLRVMERAAENIRAFHSKQVREGFTWKKEDGMILGQKVTPIEKVGLYVPGGTASYPSTVLMNAIPAKIAGCEEIVMVSPPTCNGSIAAPILAAASVAGVNRIFKVGGAQAVAALAYGTETIPKVDKIVGPGNAYVAEAKRQVFGRVNIDMIAGPSEILVVADEDNDPAYLAADLLSQAEHDKLATAVLVTDSRSLAEAVSAEVEKQLQVLPREEIARASIETNGKIIITRSLDQAIEAANALAPEHLEICVKDPMACLPKIRNAGSVFLGKYCPEAVGDYLGGPNHTLPTSGTARFSSPLSVDDFVKKTQFSYLAEEALAGLAEDIAVFARAEGLEGHARSALIRGKKA